VTVIAGKILFAEPVTLTKLVGVGLIVLGIATIAAVS